MASHEQPYDPYIPSGRAGTPGANGQHYEGNDRTAALQAVCFQLPVDYAHFILYLASANLL